MNERNYITLPIAKKLHEAGIVMQNEACWKVWPTGKKLIPVEEIEPLQWRTTSNVFYPAYTFTEVWDMLPFTIENSDNDYTTHYLRCVKGSKETWVGYQNYIKDELYAATNHNPCDAAAELLLWLTKEGGKG